VTAPSVNDEPIGFIGQYSKKLTQIKEAENSEYESMKELESKPLGNAAYSKDAPKHKGMLARAMEKDLKE